jgi:hypothetical protein
MRAPIYVGFSTSGGRQDTETNSVVERCPSKCDYFRLRRDSGAIHLRPRVGSLYTARLRRMLPLLG